MDNPLTLCKNEKCVRQVPKSLNSGVPRLYCSIRCRVAQNARQQYKRERGSDGSGMIQTATTGLNYVSRKMAGSAKAAETRFKSHLIDCLLSEDSMKRCPARFDSYDVKKLCLIHAVLREDWDELRRAEAGKHWERERTTATGFWKDECDAILPEGMNPL